jgi:ceramide glucosyltransferase
VELLSRLIFLLTILALGYHLYSVYCTLILFRLRKEGEDRVVDAFLPPVSVLKPVAGLEEGYRENFVSFCNQNYPEYEIVFALSDPSDPVISLLEELKREFPDNKVRWVVAENNRGPNYKVGNLIRAFREARHDVLLFNDSDMRVGPDYLSKVVTSFLPEEVGLVTCLYRSTHIGNLPAALHALTVQTGFVPSVAVAQKVEDLSYAFGATICTSREVLSRCGGLEPLLEYLADDYQMGNRVHSKGYSVVLSPLMLDDICGRRSFGGYFHHQLRWAVTQRVCRPGGYFASLITHATFLGLVLLAVEGFSPFGWTLFLFICAFRILGSAWLNRRIFHNREIDRYLYLVPLNDLLNTGIWFLSLFHRTVRWKSRRFRVLAGGRMAETA